jgi:uncharacterized protein (TIGR00661 family)
MSELLEPWPARPLRVAFAVQGEGRGHMTQAMAVAAWLRARGHAVAGVLIGRSARRRVPAFVLDALGAPVVLVPSPNFEADARGAIRLGRTITTTARSLGRYAPAFTLVERHLAAWRPDVLVNFFEGMTGLWALVRRPDVPIVAVGHQFMFEHPAYRFPPGDLAQRSAVRFYTRVAGARAAVRLAVSLYDAPARPRRRLRPVPPLLRPAVHALAAPRPVADDGSLLAYLLEPTLVEAVRAWAGRNPATPVHCFWDGPPGAAGPNLHFHALDGARFLERMARCRGVVCTAGFESACEAMLLGKPVLMVPVPGHYEQRCNAHDAQSVGAGLARETFDLDAFLSYLPAYAPPAGFGAWVARAEGMVVGAIEAAAVPHPEPQPA